MLAATALASCAGGIGTSAQRADNLFRDGKRLADAGACEAAIPKLRDSWQLDPTPGTLFNLADCEDRLGKHATAWRHFRQGGALLARGDDRATSLAARLAEVASRIAWLRVELASRGVDEAWIAIDDASLVARELSVELALDPGPHEIVVRAPGRVEKRWALDLKAGSRTSIAAAPGEPTPR